MIGIYKITSPTGKIYIGQSININKRFKEYCALRNCKSQTILYRSFLKHGVDKHSFETLCECEASELNDQERKFQELYKAIGLNGLNCMLTNSNSKSGCHSDKTKLLMSKNAGSFWKGKKLSDETKKKLSIAKIGKESHNKGIDNRVVLNCTLCDNEYKSYNKNSVLCSAKCRNESSIKRMFNNRITTEELTQINKELEKGSNDEKLVSRKLAQSK